MAASISNADVVSSPVGFLKLTFPASASSSLSLPLQQNSAAVGPVSSVGAATLIDSKAHWTSGQFSAASKPYFVKILTGTAAGRCYLVTANTGTQLTVDTRGASLTSMVAAGNRYQISPGYTLGSLFGTSSVPFLTNSDYALADNIRLLGAGGWEIYYHNGTSWMRKGKTGSYNDVVIYPDESMVVVRRATTPLTMAFAGEASIIPEQTELIGPESTAAANRYPVDVTLKSLGLLALPNWISAVTASDADRVQIREGNNWITYWHTGTNWRRSGTTVSQDSAKIVAGAGYLVLRRSSSVGVSDFAVQSCPY
jgi:uncharacterized protein (TIGR02597 family)